MIKKTSKVSHSEQAIPSRQQILNLKSLINTSYDELNEKYQESASLRESQLFNSYLAVVDKISEEVLAEEEKYLKIDREQMLDDKCVAISEQIVLFRDECYRLKSLLESVKIQLKKEKLKKDNISNQIYELKALHKKKLLEVESQKTSYLGIKKDISSWNKSQPEQLSPILKKPLNLSKYSSSHQMETNRNLIQNEPRRYSVVQQPPLYMYKLSPKHNKTRNIFKRGLTLNLRQTQNLDKRAQ